MAEIATLDISVDSSSVRDATANFGNLTLASKQSAVAVGASLRALKTINGVAREVGGVIHKAATEVIKLGNSYVSSSIAAHSLNGKMKQLDNHALPKQSRIAPAIMDRKAEQTANKLMTTGSPAYDDVLRAAKEYGPPPPPERFDRFLGDLSKLVRYLTASGVDGKGVPVANIVVDSIDSVRPSQQLKRSASEVRDDYARISTLNDRYGKDIPELRRDFDEVSGQKKIVDFADGIPEHIGRKYARAENFLQSFYRSLNDGMESLLQSASVDPEMELHGLGVAKESLDRKIREQAATRSDVENVQKAASEAINRTGRQDVRDFLASFNASSGQIIDVLDSIGRFREESVKARDKRLAENDSSVQSKGVVAIQNPVEQASASVGPPTRQPGIQDTQSAQLLISDVSRLFQGVIAAGAAFTWKAGGAFVGAADSFVKSGSQLEKTRQATKALTESSKANTEQTKLGTQASTQSAAATDNVTSKVVTLKQSQDDLQKSGAAQLAQMPQLTRAANDQADAYRRVADAQALQKLAGDIQFQQDQMGRSTVDQTVASTQKQYGLPVDMNSASANIIRYNEQLKYARELAGDFASTLVSGLRNGEGLWKSLGKAAISVLTKISDRLLNDVLNSLFKVNSAAAGGGLLGGGGIFGGLFGGGGGLDLGILARSPQAAAAVASGIPGLWADGGYTGPGGKNEPAGIVHAGEVVWSQKDIARAGGVGVVEAMRLGRRGYADGGVVGEGGPQLVRAQPDAAVPVRRRRADNQNDAAGSTSGVHVTVGVSVDEDGNLKAYVKNVAQSEAQSSTRQGLNDFNQQLPDRVAQINRNPRRR